jgi:hypothetical protein
MSYILNILAYHILSHKRENDLIEFIEITFSSISELRQKILTFAIDYDCVPMIDLSEDNLHDVTFDIKAHAANLNYQGAIYKIDHLYIEHEESQYKITGEARAKLISIKRK